MAEGLAFNIAESLLKQAGTLALQEIGKIRGVKGELTELEKTVTRIQVLLLDAEEKQDHNHQDMHWLEELKEVVYEADDLLDDFATEILGRKAVGGGFRVIKEARIFCCGSNQILFGHNMANSIKGVRDRMKKIADDRVDWHLNVKPKEKARQEETYSSPPDYFVGRDGDIDHVLRLLMVENSEIVSLVGIRGIGKTALAQVIFHDRDVICHFELMEWVYASDPFDVKMVAKKILESVTDEIQPDYGLDTMLRRLEAKIGGRRFLFVLDDVWSNDKWGDIWKLLKIGAEGSKILVTTRFIEVARIASQSVLPLKGLSSADSLSLLKQMVFRGQPLEPHVVSRMEKIVKKCDGVPRAIQLISNLRRLNDPETECSHFTNQDPFAHADNANAILTYLRSNYDHLPLHLKQCFAYCSLFPKDFVIDVKSLIHMWVAQGFITKSSDEIQTLEDIGSKYFVDLSGMSFFEDVEKDSLGMVKTCKLSHLMHRLATAVASTECKMVSQYEDRITNKVHHMSLHFDLEPPRGTPDFLGGADQLRTFLLLAQGSSSAISRTWDDSSCKALVSCFKRLRVFDLHNTGIDNLSSSVKRLKQLRYLDMSQNGIRLLPRSISKLQNLQVIKLSDCREIIELPEDIAKLVGLQHIYCEGCSSLVGMPIGLGDLTSLQTLTWFVLSKDGTRPTQIGGPSVLKKLKNLRGRMEIRNLGWRKANTSEFKDANMVGKEFLQSLTLRWNGDDETRAAEAVANYDEEALSGLQPHQNLRELQVYRYGGASFPGWLSSMINLVNIRVDGCQRCKSLPPLSSVHSLRELCLIDLTDLEYVVDENVDSVNRGEDDTTFFPSLKTLLLLNCPKLKGWRKGTGDGHDAQATLLQFPCLSLLEVKKCPKLNSLPRLPARDGRLCLNDTSNLEPVDQLLKIKMTPTLSQGLKLPSWLAISKNLVEVRITDCKGCELLPPFDQIAFLNYIYLKNLPDSKYIDVDNDNSQDEGLAFFPFLKKLWILDCPKLRGWQKKGNCGDRENFQQFSCLSFLQIKNCPELSWMPAFPTLQESFYFMKSGVHSFPKRLSFTNLQVMSIENIPEMEFLDLDGDHYITGGAQTATIFPFLKTLCLLNCLKLKGWWKMTDDEARTMKREEFPQFACLSFLEIKNCPELSWMPAFSTLKERFYFVNSGVHSFPKRLSFINLQVMSIENIPELEFLDLDGDNYMSGSSQSATIFPFLEKLLLLNCPKLKGWCKMTDDEARTMKREEFPQFACLSSLEINNCPGLSWMPAFPTLQEKFYFIKSGVHSFPKRLSFTNLKEMSIENIPELEFLDLDGDHYITGISQSATIFPNLKKLWLWNCPKLKGWWKMTDDEARTMKREEFPQFASLSFLEIKNCPRLSWMPAFPTLQEKFYFIKSGVHSFPKRLSFTNLEVMSIEKMPELEFLDLDGDSYITGSAHSATIFPFLKKLWLLNCPKLKGWWRMTDYQAATLKTEKFPQFPCLSFLEIKNCPELSWMPTFPTVQENLVWDSTSTASLWQTMKTTTWVAVSSSHVHPLSKLKVLELKRINDLEYLPQEWLQNLISLEKLYIESCPRLTSLPKGMHHLTSLKELEVWYCPQLTERCGRNNGMDWPNIDHIPKIKIDGKEV